MTIMAQKIQLKNNNWTNPNKNSVKEAIHSGHFMVSDFEAEEQDEDELAVPVPEEVETKTTVVTNPMHDFLFHEFPIRSPGHQLTIETSLSKLFQCMSLAYRQKLTSPKWNRFKGIRLRWKDKIRLNNVIWRCWHIQFINKKKTLVCQFASPLDVDTHNKPEAVVLEGKYWKRKLNAVTAEYKKWRMFCHNQIIGKPLKNHDIFTELDSQDCWPLTGDNMLVDEDYMGLMTDTLFSTITAQPFPFPDPREIARNTNLADFIQPSLVQLQPNLDEIMEIEPLHDLLQASTLSTVPEENSVLQLVAPSYQSKTSGTIEEASSYSPGTFESSERMWYLPPEFVDRTTSQVTNLPPPYPQASMTTTPPSSSSQVSALQHTIGPPAPPLPPVLPRKPDVFTSPKTKSKGRSRNSSKKGATYDSNNQQSLVVQIMSTSPTQQHQSQEQVKQTQQTSSLQNTTLLAQILTSNSNTSYGFLPKEPVVPLQCKIVGVNSNCEEVSNFMQQSFAPIDNRMLYKVDNNLHKSTRSYRVNSNSNSNNNNKNNSCCITTLRNSSDAQSLLNKNIQQSIPNMGTVSTDTINPSDPSSLSPLNVASPTSPTALKDVTPNKEQRRVCHINAEQKRRCNIKNGFDTLHSLISQSGSNPNAKMSKASMLQKGAVYIRQLRTERTNLKQEIDTLRQEIETLNSAICNCQAMLPATGAPISRQRTSKMRDMFRHYVKKKTRDNWKFWLLSLICEPLLESFNNYVSTSSLDELYTTTLQWVDQHCTLVILRQVVMNSLRQLSTTTEVLTDPSRLPNEARAAVDKSYKKQS